MPQLYDYLKQSDLAQLTVLICTVADAGFAFVFSCGRL